MMMFSVRLLFKEHAKNMMTSEKFDSFLCFLGGKKNWHKQIRVSMVFNYIFPKYVLYSYYNQLHVNESYSLVYGTYENE